MRKENHMRKIEYENKLRELGFPQIGSGIFSNVFAFPNNPDKAIKVGKDDDAWPSYIKWATEKGYAGKFAPKVDSLKFRDGFYVAIMERLIATMREIVYEGGDNSYQNRLYQSEIISRGGKAKDLIEFVTDLRDAGLTGDLHPGNVMVRKDGQIVVTDPVAYDNRPKPFRIKSGQITAA